jgi:hypothetical protein
MSARGNLLRVAARLLVAAWGLGWCSFAAAYLWLTQSLTGMDLAASAVWILVVAGSASLAWGPGRLGPAVLATEGLLVLIGYPLRAPGNLPLGTVLFTMMALGLPPLAAGLALLTTHRSSHGDAGAPGPPSVTSSRGAAS